MKIRAEDNGTVRLFVYGTLKKGHPNAVLLHKAGAKFVGYDTITGDFHMVSMGGFPAVCPVSHKVGNATIYGEIWSTDEEGLASCDLLEGHPNWYEREKIWSDKLKKRVWVYLLPGRWEKEADDVVAGGIWRPTDDERQYWRTRGVDHGAAL